MTFSRSVLVDSMGVVISLQISLLASRICLVQCALYSELTVRDGAAISNLYPFGY